MRVAHVFATGMAVICKLATMILSQVEEGRHGATAVGMFFFDDNLYRLHRDDPVGERLARVAAAQGILLMVCDQCAVRRGMAEGAFQQCGRGEVVAKGTVEGGVAGCFPQLHRALAGNPPDLVVTL